MKTSKERLVNHFTCPTAVKHSHVVILILYLVQHKIFNYEEIFYDDDPARHSFCYAGTDKIP